MIDDTKHLGSHIDRNSVVTAIDTTVRFPESLGILLDKYHSDIDRFAQMIRDSDSSAALLAKIRSPSVNKDVRMSLLKMFRRCVSPVLDTEATKKISKISTESLVDNYGYTFKPIEILKQQFAEMDSGAKAALAVLIGEYDTRGHQGYALTDQFFNWFESRFAGVLKIEGPRGAGRDIELSTIFKDFDEEYPCDFVISKADTLEILAIGFARYDATRGGAQSDDRTSGNAYKVSKAREYCQKSGDKIRIIFVADGPGLVHKDTWNAACLLDNHWDGNVRVTTLKLADYRITADWLLGVASN